MAVPSPDAPCVPILLLGDNGTGKSTFLSRLMLGSNKSLGPIKQLPLLRDLDQPFTLHIRLYDRPYRFEFYDTASPTNYTLLRPELIILCYSIADPESLRNVHTEWKTLVETHFNYDERLPVILLGLMRDIRQKEDYDGNVRRVESVGDGDQEPLNARRIVYPQEALKVAQEMRIDRYCECSARTGELCREVFEDIAKTAALTTTEKGGRSSAPYCAIM